MIACGWVQDGLGARRCLLGPRMIGRMVFRSPVERVTPNRLTGERDALTQQLDFHRATLLRKLDGLDDESLRRPMTATYRHRRFRSSS